MAKESYIISENKVYKKVDKELYSTYVPCAVPVEKPVPVWKGPKIPFDLWMEMVAWCQVTQEKFKSEALCFLFLDLQNKENPWSVWYPPQKTQGMTVQAREDAPEYAEQRKAFPDLQFGTLHHHCNSPAFASGIDKDDEIDREGLHFTIGKLGSDKHDIHYRFSVEGACYEGHVCDVVEMLPNVAALPEKYARSVHSSLLHDPVDHSRWDFSDPLDNVQKVSHANTNGYNRRNKPTQTTIGGVIEDEDPIVANQIPLGVNGEMAAKEEFNMLTQVCTHLVADAVQVLAAYPEVTGIKDDGDYFLHTTYEDIYKDIYMHLTNNKVNITDNGALFKLKQDLIDLIFEWTGYERNPKMMHKDKMYAEACYKHLKAVASTFDVVTET